MSRSEIKQKLMEQNMMVNLEVVKKEENDFFPCSPHKSTTGTATH